MPCLYCVWCGYIECKVRIATVGWLLRSFPDSLCRKGSVVSASAGCRVYIIYMLVSYTRPHVCQRMTCSMMSRPMIRIRE